MLSRKDALFATLARDRGFVNGGDLARAMKLLLASPANHGIDKVFLEAGMIDRAQRKQLIRAFNAEVRRIKGGTSGKAAPEPTHADGGAAADGLEEEALTASDEELAQIEVPDDILAAAPAASAAGGPAKPTGGAASRFSLLDSSAFRVAPKKGDSGAALPAVGAMPPQPPKRAPAGGGAGNALLLRAEPGANAPLQGAGAEGGRPITDDDLRSGLKSGADFRGRRVGDYEIKGEIARGGMGVVFASRPKGLSGILGKERGLSEEVALKVILSGSKADQAEIDRFSQEVKTLINLAHPNVIRIYDSGVENGLFYYAMELIDGPNMREVVSQGVPSLLLSLRVVREIASALSTIHRASVYHRDMKPSNILLDRQSSPYRPVLIDFGLVKETHHQASEGGLILGTPQYMPPEQAKPRGGFGEIGAASDIYSLGATFYYMLTGVPPFDDKNPRVVIKQVVEARPRDPREINGLIPARVAGVCLRCLEKKQEDRYPTGDALIRDLDKIIAWGHRQVRLKRMLDRIWPRREA